MKVAEIISVGSELLMGQIADTNAQALGALLPELGIAHYRRQTVGDNLVRLTEALRVALERSDIVFTIGGLGPTEDDLTRDGIAVAFGVGMELDAEIEEKLRRFFAQRKLPWVESIGRQAQRPEGAEAIENRNGTAPGLWMERDGKIVIALPGPRNEFYPMLRNSVAPRLAALNPAEVIASRILKVIGMGESVVESTLGDLIHSENPTVAPYAKTGEVHLRLSCRDSDPKRANERLDVLEVEIRTKLGHAVFGKDEDTVEGSAVHLLIQRGETISVAESITGGGLAKRLTGVPGVSQTLRGGMVTYQVEAKEQHLKVDLREGPVSAYTAQQMAEGVRTLFGSTWGIATTGNAGPTSDVDAKPVGLVYIAVAGPAETTVEEFQYRGEREAIRTRTEQAALGMLRNRLIHEP